MSDKCPVCGMPVRIIRRKSGAADHYEPIQPQSSDDLVVTLEKDVADWLKKERQGKRTVALVGTATTSCGLAPYKEDVELWACNETHNYKWMTRATRWFQIHKSESFKREVDSHGNRGHYDWLKANPWNIPIYMQFHHEEISLSVAYPLHEVRENFFKNFWRGRKKINYLTSSLAYMIPIAILDGFERIELYGFEMSDDTEYVKQKACAEFWIGQAIGRGIEVYTPDDCQLLNSNLYGGRGYGW